VGDAAAQGARSKRTSGLKSDSCAPQWLAGAGRHAGRGHALLELAGARQRGAGVAGDVAVGALLHAGRAGAAVLERVARVESAVRIWRS
jgi:hypothetical protein